MTRVRDVNGRYAPEAGPDLHRAFARMALNQAEPTHAGSLPDRETIKACAPEEGDPDADGTVYLVAMRGYVDAERGERRVVAEYVGSGDAYLARDVEGARLVHHDGEFGITMPTGTVSEIPRSLRVDPEECRHVDEVAHVGEAAKERFQAVLDTHAELLGGSK
ncbi:hypothetical protein [Halococcus hamelinensis]|uniref:Uncharacterized protein n=1 Tax=Halococcus hamelinensis 100A6 TaxID=1132509 RepID=M0LY18_9EURY|nr:hypothetical protein [Halococcus hamelinensis]EMA38482.1 hypothetical protein C447_10017 [Halococcus hamelinensis 100A6]